MAEDRTCCLKRCIQGALHWQQGRVEMKTFEVSEEDKKHMEIDWHEDGQAVFHDICWKAVLDSLKMENPFTLSPQEKEMLFDAKKTAEYFDSFQKLSAEAARIAQLLKNSQHAIAFTGAGISTLAGIGDFRGKCGKWTERDREKRHGAPKFKTRTNLAFEALRPTYTHEALERLVDMGYLRHIISQNTDSLHRLSGIARDKLSELHGNCFHERCEKCLTRFERPFAVRRQLGGKVSPKICPHCHFDHRTGRMCERKDCDGVLINTIINFGDSLEKRVLSLASEQARRNDLVLCLGTSLRVIPASDLIDMGAEPIRLVICNRQPTLFDKICYEVDDEGCQMGSRVYGDCDALMREIMKNVMAEDDLKEWEEGREARMEEYDKQRVKPGGDL